MLRSITIFSFFALATVLVIVLQPGPRPDYAFEQGASDIHEASRNQVNVLPEPSQMPTLQAPDEVISELKAAAQVQKPAVSAEPTSDATSAGSLTRLQAALNASLGMQDVQTDAAPAAPEVLDTRPTAAPSPYPTLAPELRDMSWQTLNALNGLGRASKAPGQEGSLLNSIVRRSMGQVTAQPVGQANRGQQIKATIAPSIVKPATQAAHERNYVVASGDTLALIAIKLYGSALAKDKLLSQNPALRKNPNDLRIGQVLRYTTQ